MSLSTASLPPWSRLLDQEVAGSSPSLRHDSAHSLNLPGSSPEGQGAPRAVPGQPGVVTIQGYGFDDYGNVNSFTDLGDASNSNAYTADDLFASVEYATDPDAIRLYWS